MNQLFRTMGISKQSFHQYHNRLLMSLEEEAYIVKLIEQIRKDHPTMGCRAMYHKLSPKKLGRDAFEDLCREEGFMAKRKRNYRRTTQSSGVKRFENLARDLVVDGPDQLWASDITYIEIEKRFYYITFVIDVYTRRIVGFSVSDRLTTEATTLSALKMAIKTRRNKNLKGLVFHSDGGGQYYDKAFLKLTQEHGIINSMCKYAWENPYAERINGTIKNNYLQHWEIKTFVQLQKSVDRAVKLYNQEKPHKGLNRLSPIEYEKQYICNRETNRR